MNVNPTMRPSEIAISLRNDILSGRVLPGHELVQDDLARRFGVSRIPIRDALNSLAIDKLVRLRPNRSALVISYTRDELAEVFSLRLVLELNSISCAISNFTETDISKISHEAKKCEIESGHEGFPEADWRFHQALYAPANRPIELALIKQLRESCQIYAANYTQLREQRNRFSKDHRLIVSACEDRDKKSAIENLKSHLVFAASSLDNFLKDKEAQG